VYLLALIPHAKPLFNIYFSIIQRDNYFFKTEYPGNRTLLVHSSGRQAVKRGSGVGTLSDACSKHKCKGE
jgi:hypothetical protein